MARTAAPVASWYPAALFAPTVAAAHRYPRLLASRASSALPGLDAVSRPPAGGPAGKPPGPGRPPNRTPATIGPALGIAPLWTVAAVSSAYAAGPARTANSARTATARA